MSTLTNKYGLPEAFAAAIGNDPYDNGGADRSVTELIGPAKAAALKRRYKDQISRDVMDMLFLLDGQLMHALLERAGKRVGAEVERRLFCTIKGWNISGQFDALRLDGVTLVDYKRVPVASVASGVKPDHEAQVNCLAYLLAANGHKPVERLQIVTWYRDWMKPRAGKNGHPNKPAHTWDVPLWPIERQRAFLEARVTAHQQAQQALDLGDTMPRCTEAETWEGRRCALGYCEAAKFCQQALDAAGN